MRLNKLFDVCSRFFHRAFCCFSLITVIMAIVGNAISSDELAKYMSVKQIIVFFVFSLLYALSFGLADLIKENNVIKRSVQFVLTYVSLIAVFWFGGIFSNYLELNGVQNKGFSILAISFMFVILYVLIGLAVLLFGFIKRKITQENIEYKSIFENKE